jgi:hypothetical protein
MLPQWWNVLRKVVRRDGAQDGERLLVADQTQDVYGRGRAWTDQAMVGAGFSGDWVRLSVSYRLPPALIPFTSAFLAEFLSDEDVEVPEADQTQMDLYPCALRWVQTGDLAAAAEREVKHLLRRHDCTRPPMSPLSSIRSSVGTEIVARLEASGFRTLHTFGARSDEKRRRKLAFFYGSERLKVTTLHGFKGWEARSVIVCIGRVANRRAKALLYTGITRLKRHEAAATWRWLLALPRCRTTGALGRSSSWKTGDNRSLTFAYLQ